MRQEGDHSKDTVKKGHSEEVKLSRNLQAEGWGKNIPGRGNGLGSLENPGRKWGWGRGREEGKWPRKGVGQQAESCLQHGTEFALCSKSNAKALEGFKTGACCDPTCVLKPQSGCSVQNGWRGRGEVRSDSSLATGGWRKRGQC